MNIPVPDTLVDELARAANERDQLTIDFTVWLLGIAIEAYRELCPRVA